VRRKRISFKAYQRLVSATEFIDPIGLGWFLYWHWTGRYRPIAQTHSSGKAFRDRWLPAV